MEDIFRGERGRGGEREREAEAIEEKERGGCGTRLLGTHASGRGLPTNVRKEHGTGRNVDGEWMKEWKRSKNATLGSLTHI